MGERDERKYLTGRLARRFECQTTDANKVSEGRSDIDAWIMLYESYYTMQLAKTMLNLIRHMEQVYQNHLVQGVISSVFLC